jgi:hypothetical protein
MSKKVKGKKAATGASKTLTEKTTAEQSGLTADSALSQTRPLDHEMETNTLTEATAAVDEWTNASSGTAAASGAFQQAGLDRNIAFWMWA